MSMFKSKAILSVRQSRVSKVSLSGEGQRWCLLMLIMGNVINAGIKC